MKRILPLALMLAPSMAMAHPGHGAGLTAGFVHPFTGADHLLAMTGVGLWAALLGGRARWALPSAFLAAMALGGGLAMQGALGGLVGAVEPAIMASVIVLGATLALALRAPLSMALSVAALFGFAHGAAHGVEATGNGFAFAAAMLLATGLLHGLGLAIGGSLNLRTLRLAGLATLLAGVGLAVAG